MLRKVTISPRGTASAKLPNRALLSILVMQISSLPRSGVAKPLAQSFSGRVRCVSSYCAVVDWPFSIRVAGYRDRQRARVNASSIGVSRQHGRFLLVFPEKLCRGDDAPELVGEALKLTSLDVLRLPPPRSSRWSVSLVMNMGAREFE